MKKKTLALTLIVGAFLMTTGCSSKKPTQIAKAESTYYTAYGRYYTDGTVITNETDDGYDAMLWEYSTDTISDKTPYDGMPIRVVFDDNGTPADIYDDIILGVVYDRNTAIYDQLEDALSDKFELERDGNNLHIIKNVETTEDGTLYTLDDSTGYYVEEE